MNAGRRHVGGAELHVSKIMFDAGRVALDVTVAEVLGEANHREQLHLVPWRKRGQIVLIPSQVNLGVWGHMAGICIRKQKFACSGIRRWKIYRHGCVLEWQGNIGQRVGIKADGERNRASNEIVLPQVGDDGCNRATGVQNSVAGQGVVRREPWSPSVPVLVVGWLRVV